MQSAIVNNASSLNSAIAFLFICSSFLAISFFRVSISEVFSSNSLEVFSTSFFSCSFFVLFSSVFAFSAFPSRFKSFEVSTSEKSKVLISLGILILFLDNVTSTVKKSVFVSSTARPLFSTIE